MSRWRAAGLHLVISVVVAIAAFALVFFLWYPSPLFEASGGDRLVLLLIGIDIVIGPLLTLIVFRAGKPGMRFDLGFIATCQALALAYGMHVVTVARPVFVVFAVDRFVLVPGNSLADEDLEQAREPAFRARSWRGPVWVASVLPSDTDERMNLAMSGAAGKDIERFPKYYEPYAAHAAEALARARPIDVLQERDAQRLETFLAGRTDREQLVVLPLIGRARELSVVLDKRSGAVVTVLPIDPW